MAAAVEGAQVDFDTAIEIEGRYFVDLVTGQVAKNMIQAFFFDLQQRQRRPRPPGGHRARSRRSKIVVLGAGHDGRRDRLRVREGRASRSCSRTSRWRPRSAARATPRSWSPRRVERGRSTQEKGDALLARITPTADPADANGADLVIEAVFEDPAVKARGVRRRSSRIWRRTRCSGPTPRRCRSPSLAESVTRPEDFIGLHFFSPVDKMPLLEIIKGEQTTDETLYRALDFAKLIKKTPIVVNDSRGFFTSRVIGTFINEGIAMLLEGVPGADDRAGLLAGRLPGPGAAAVRRAQPEADAQDPRRGPRPPARSRAAWGGHPSEQVIDRMLDELGRPGRLEGAGFYEYADGKRVGLWPGLQARRSRRSTTRRRSRSRTSRSGCCSSRRSSPSSASTRA